MNSLKKFIKNVKRYYVLRPLKYIEFSRPVWRWFNRRAIEKYKQHPPQLDDVQGRIIADMRKNGFAITSVHEFFGKDTSAMDDIYGRLDDLVASSTQDPKKVHFRNFWNTRNFVLDPKNGFTKFAMSQRIVDVANEYLGMWSKFKLSNGYYSNKMEKGTKKVQTQQWHRDLHDVGVVYVFVYLNDVDSVHDGPFWYLRGSHTNGKYWKLAKAPRPYSKRSQTPADQERIESLPEDDKVACLGKKGTMVIADIKGLHNGGYSTANQRIAMLSCYVSSHPFSKTKRYSYDKKDLEELKKNKSPQVLYAFDLQEK